MFFESYYYFIPFKKIKFFLYYFQKKKASFTYQKYKSLFFPIIALALKEHYFLYKVFPLNLIALKHKNHTQSLNHKISSLITYNLI